MNINLYRITTKRKRTGLYPPVVSFIAIAKDVGEAEGVVKEFLNKEEVIITSVSLLKDFYHFNEGDYYIVNKNIITQD